MESKIQVGTLIFIGTGLITLLVLFVLFLALFYQSYVMKIKRKEAELLLKTSLESEKLERQRIAADIHDGVSGDLNAIRNFLTVLYRAETNEEKKKIFEDIKQGVEAALENTRLVSYRLMPPLLETSGLFAALQDYFERIKKKEAAKFVLHCQIEAFDLPNEISYEVFRIIQEFTTNMIKYGRISCCEIIFYKENEDYMILIKDDGISYDFKELYAVSKGTGLKNINSRLKVIEADFNQIKVDKGNQFLISIKDKK